MRFENGLFQITPEFIRAPEEVSKKIAQPGELVIAGYATTYDKGLDNAVISRRALEQATNDLRRRSTVLFNHNQDLPIGRIHEAKLDDKGLFVTAIIDKSEEKIQEKIKSGTLSKFSIRGRILASHEEWDDKTQKATSIIDKLKLLEVSVVSVPAVDAAEIQSWYVQRSAMDEDFQPLQRDVNSEQGGDIMSDEIKDLETQSEEEVQTSEEPEAEDLLEAVESTQLELLLDLEERVSSLVERTDELLKAVKLDDLMNKLKAIEELLKKVWEKVEKYPYPYPYPAKKSAPQEEGPDESEEEKASAEEKTEDVGSSVSKDLLESVRALKEEVKELKETVVVKGERVESVAENAVRKFIESDEYKNADPSEKLRLLWDFAEKTKGGEI